MYLSGGEIMNENEKSTSLFYDMPTGLSYALSRNVGAMRTFCIIIQLF